MMNRILFFFFVVLSISFFSCSGDGYTYAEIETEFGTMKVKLYNDTPLHRDNFIKLANEQFYDDLLFHRVIQGFMIQGGDPESKDAGPDKVLGGGGPGYQIPAEFKGWPHVKGALAAARTGDNINPEKKSSGSQFYIVQGKKATDAELNSMERARKMTYPPHVREKYKEVGGAYNLDMEYTVFGEVVEGLEVIDKIAAMPTGSNNRPVKDVKMKVRILN